MALNLAFVAAGNADGAWEFNTSPWDVAAGLCILEEAGGVATDGENTPYTFELDTAGTRKPLLVSNSSLHERLIERLHE